MADFVKKTWACGDTITADELNRLEGGVEEALDKGYSCTEGWTTLTDESVTTEHPEGAPEGIYAGTLQGISEDMTATSLRITFDGTQYICSRNIDENDDAYYGASATYSEQGVEYDWSEYPFSLAYESITTQTDGAHTVKIEEMRESIETTECFEKAIRNSIKVYNVSMLASTSRTVDPQERVSNYSTFEYSALDMDGNEVEFSTLDYDVIMLTGFSAHGLIIEKCGLGFMTLFNPSTSTTTRPIINRTNTYALWIAIKF